MHNFRLTRLASLLTLCLGTAAFAHATGSTPKHATRPAPKTTHPEQPATGDQPTTNEKPADAGNGKNGYPDAPKKNLYADNDLRGKPAPEFKVEKWINGNEPNRKDKTVLIDFWATWC